MVSTANVTEEVTNAFTGVTTKQLRWATCKVDGANVVLVATGPRESTLEELVSTLGDEPMYVVFDFEAVRPDSSSLCKTCFISYAPDSNRNMASKFALQNFKQSVKGKINCQKEMQVNDKADLTVREFNDAFGL